MKKILLVLFLCFLVFTSTAFADSLVSDPQSSNIGLAFEIWQAAKGLTDATKITSTGTLITTKTLEADGSLKYVLNTLPSGSYNWYIRTAGAAYIYGPDNTPGGSTVYSDFVPFDFTKRTVAAGSITGLKLVP